MQALASMPVAAQADFRERFGDAFISPRFRDNVTKNTRTSTWPKLLRHLLSKPEGVSGHVSVLGTNLERVLYSIGVIHVPGNRGPEFHCSKAVWVDDPTIERIQQKLG